MHYVHVGTGFRLTIVPPPQKKETSFQKHKKNDKDSIFERGENKTINLVSKFEDSN